MEATVGAGFVLIFARADLLAQLGNTEEALRTYAALDNLPFDARWHGLLIRSWAERGALHEQLGERDKAIEWYTRFLATLVDADDTVQPMVQRVERALAELQGTVGER